MTKEEEHQQMRDAFESVSKRLLADPEACRKWLQELGALHLGVPIKSIKKKSTKKSTKPSRPSARKK